MNIFAELFGIFRQRGLVKVLEEGKPLSAFIVLSIIISLVGSVLYGFVTGIGLNLETAVKDGIKVGLIVILNFLLGIPIFLLTYRLMGREERPVQIAAIPLTMVLTSAIVLAVTSPLVFLLSVLTSFSSEAVYVHIVIVNVALLIGIYLAGTLIYYAFQEERNKLIVPNVVGFLMMIVILFVLLSFFRPFLDVSSTFSFGTDKLKDRLGIGVAEKVGHALTAASSADRMSYRFQTTNANGDIERDYTVNRVENNYLIQMHFHAVPGGTVHKERNIWILKGTVYTDFDGGHVLQSSESQIKTYLESAQPQDLFNLPQDFINAGWRAHEKDGDYVAVGIGPGSKQIKMCLESDTLRLKELTFGKANAGVQAQIRVLDIGKGTLDPESLAASLNKAIVVGSIDKSDASMETYVQDKAFFAVRYPRMWRAGAWDPDKCCIEFFADSPANQPAPSLEVRVYNLARNKGVKQYADDLAHSLNLQPAYRKVRINILKSGRAPVGLVEYLYDRPVKVKTETTHHWEYIFAGRISRYHLDFSAPENKFDKYQKLFEIIAGYFVYLQ